MATSVVGVIGGSGVYELPGLENMREERIDTPWGAPSDALRFGTHRRHTRGVFAASRAWPRALALAASITAPTSSP